jgi:hypothetical protein
MKSPILARSESPFVTPPLFQLNAKSKEIAALLEQKAAAAAASVAAAAAAGAAGSAQSSLSSAVAKLTSECDILRQQNRKLAEDLAAKAQQQQADANEISGCRLEAERLQSDLNEQRLQVRCACALVAVGVFQMKP